MMRWIVTSSLNFRFLVVVIAAAVMFFGISQLRNTPVDVLPEFAPPFVEVQTEALGLSALEVESLVTLNIEELVSGVSWVKTTRSTSVPGLSSVTLIFEPGTDLMRARQLVAERLTSTFMLPNVSKAPVMLPPQSATSRVMVVGVSSKEVPPLALGVLAHWTIRPALLSVPSVANVSIWGQRDRQLQVQVDQGRLRANKIKLDDVIKTTGNAMFVSPLTFLNASTPGTGGFIDTPGQRLEIRHVLPISTAADLAKVAVSDERKSDGSPLRLGDLGLVVEGHQPLIGDAVLKDGPGLLLVVEKLPGSNTLDVTRAVEAKLNTLRPGLPGIKIDTTVFRPATFIQLAIDHYARALLLGALLVVLVLLAFFGHWRPALVGVAAILSSLAAAVLVLHLRGATFNVMVLTGLVIVIGAVVDDAIVGVENILRRLRRLRAEGGDTPLAAIVLDASLEMRGALLFATLIMLLAVVPVLFFEDVLGAFLQPLAVSYALAVLASMVVALTLAPALSVMVLSNGSQERREPSLIPWLHRGYDRLLARTIRRPRAMFAAAGVIALAGLAVLPFLRLSLLPSFKEPDLMVQLDGPPATSHPEMARITTRVGRELQVVPGVRNFGAHIGRALMGDQVVGINSATLWVGVDPSVNYGAMVAAVEKVVKGYPGLVHHVQTYTEKTLRQTLTGSSDSMVVRLYGPDLTVLRSKAGEVRRALSGIDGVVGLHSERQFEEPHVEIEVDLARAARHGLKPGDVRRQAATLVNGVQAGSLFEGQKVFDVVVWSTPNARQTLNDIRNLLIDTPGGGHVRLADVAAVRIAPTLTAINREAISRRFDVGFNVRGRDPGSVSRDVRRVLQRVEFPLEHRAALLGEFDERQEARRRTLIAGVVGAIGIFLLLQAFFRSWRLAMLTLLTWPAALAGGALAAFAGGGTLTLGSLAGFLAVGGIAARGGMTLIGHLHHLGEQEGEPFGPGLVLRGSRERLAPILMTALTAGLVFVPFVLSGNIPGFEIVYPMALVVLGGLVTSTWINLFVVPSIYMRFGDGSAEPALYLPPATVAGHVAVTETHIGPSKEARE